MFQSTRLTGRVLVVGLVVELTFDPAVHSVTETVYPTEGVDIAVSEFARAQNVSELL